MGLHKSLKIKNKLVRRRNVLTRDERVEKLEKDEKRVEGESVFALPKVRVEYRAPRRAKDKAKEAEAAAAALGGVEAPVEGALPPAEPAAPADEDKGKGKGKGKGKDKDKGTRKGKK